MESEAVLVGVAQHAHASLLTRAHDYSSCKKIMTELKLPRLPAGHTRLAAILGAAEDSGQALCTKPSLLKDTVVNILTRKAGRLAKMEMSCQFASVSREVLVDAGGKPSRDILFS